MPRRPDRPPQPLTDAQLRAMRKNGDPISSIMQRAYQRNGLGRDAVRAILFGGHHP